MTCHWRCDVAGLGAVRAHGCRPSGRGELWFGGVRVQAGPGGLAGRTTKGQATRRPSGGSKPPPPPPSREATGSADAVDATLVPDRLGRLVDPAVGAEDQEPVERPREPAVVGDRQHGAVEAVQARPRAPRRWPGRGCPSARRAAAAWPRPARAAGSGTAPAGRRRACRRSARPARRARSGRSAPMAGPMLQRARAPRARPAGCGRPARGARGSGRSARAPPGRRASTRRWCATGPPASSRRKCDLPEPLLPSTATRSPYKTSRSNGCISPVSSSPVADDRALAGPPAGQPHPDVLRLGRAPAAGPASSNFAQPGLHGLVAVRHVRARSRPAAAGCAPAP